MTVSDTVERVARAFHEHDEQKWSSKPDAWDSLHHTAQEQIIEAVQFILTALRPGDELPGGLVVVDLQTLLNVVKSRDLAPLSASRPEGDKEAE